VLHANAAVLLSDQGKRSCLSTEWPRCLALNRGGLLALVTREQMQLIACGQMQIRMARGCAENLGIWSSLVDFCVLTAATRKSAGGLREQFRSAYLSQFTPLWYTPLDLQAQK